MKSGRSRIVFDTSVLIGVVLRPQSFPSSAFELALLGGELVASVETMAELSEVLRRPHLDRYRSLDERLEFLALFQDSVALHDVTDTVNVCRDPKDNKFLSLALSTGATLIVSSDEDLLVLLPYRGIQILTAAQFLDAAGTILNP